ncbi:MAG TPA: toxin-antitoxin system YwqK family antitoxin [Thermoanaerobaculia bacterium]|nr:toxin-antitoxin system YwqK family antitoxin [Thermoanaerobaculia bacterium]
MEERVVETYDEEGWLAQRATVKDGLLDGELVQYGPDGQPQAIMHYAAGKLEGEAVFYDNGQPQLRMFYRNGLQHGETTVYGPTGLPTATSQHRAGKLEGMSAWYRPDGTMLRSAEYADGLLDGESIEYDERGRAAQRTLYRAGEPVPEPRGARR